MKRTKAPAPLRASVICDARGRILVAMATLALSPAKASGRDQRGRPGRAGLKAGRGTTVHEIEVPADLIADDGGLQALVSGYTVRKARGARGAVQLVARRAER